MCVVNIVSVFGIYTPSGDEPPRAHQAQFALGIHTPCTLCAYIISVFGYHTPRDDGELLRALPLCASERLLYLQLSMLLHVEVTTVAVDATVLMLLYSNNRRSSSHVPAPITQ